MAEVIWRSDESGGDEAISAGIAIECDEYGVLSITETLHCRDEPMASDALFFTGEDCPLQVVNATRVSSSASRAEGDTWEITREFKALASSEIPNKVLRFKLNTVAGKEPIQSHRNFLTENFAGVDPTHPNPLSGAVWDFTHTPPEFVKFQPYLSTSDPLHPVKNKHWAGVTDYLMPLVTFEESRVCTAADLGSYGHNLDKIENSMPQTKMLPVWEGRTWLLTECKPEWVCDDVFMLRRVWTLSGARGWDVDIYPDKYKSIG